MRYSLHTTVIFIIIAAALLFGSCNAGRTQYTIGVSHYEENEWSKQMNIELAQEANLQDMYDLRFAAAGGDIDRQIEQIRAFVESKVDVIVVVTSLLRPLYPAISEAYDRGVKIVVYGEPTIDKYHSSIHVRDSIVGLAIGRKIAALLDDGGTIIELRSANI